MLINTTPPVSGRDRRLDLFRGVANWAIFLDHIPNNVVAWITTRNYGFSDAAELFIFMSGYMTSLVCANIMLRRGFVAGTAWLMKRVWRLYVAHIFLFVLYVAVIGSVAQSYDNPELINEFNIAGLLGNPFDILTQGLLLRFKPLNMDVLPLYIVLLASMPPILWLMLRLPDATMLGSLCIYFVARHFGWNFTSYPGGEWYFNPFTWQLLFVVGAWFAVGGERLRPLTTSRGLLYVGVAYLLFSLVMTMANHIPYLANELPIWLFDAFNPNDKTNLAPYRVIHFVFIALVVTRFLPTSWRGLQSRILQPLIKCGEQSLNVFCSGVLLSFLAHFVLEAGSRTVWTQIVVSAAGLSLMTAIAYFATWFKSLDMPRSLLLSEHPKTDVCDTADSDDTEMSSKRSWLDPAGFSYEK